MARSFTLLRTIGEGAFGSVHLAQVHDEEDFVQTLAVKWLHPRWSEDPDLARRLRDEARLLGLLRHEHVVRVHGLTRIEGRLAILMEVVDGVDLARLGTAPPRVAAEIGYAVADALAAAWSAIPPGKDEPLRVVHRDIKPSNIMVTARGVVKVMDFGVARASFDAREASTRSQQFGTARYMAPERWLHGTAEAPSDVFSLGVTLIELVTGEPFPQPRLSLEGFQADVGQAVDRIPDPDLRDLVAAMCAFAPGERPSAPEVSQRCLELARSGQGRDLRSWAAEVVPQRRSEGSAAPTGTVVVEDTPVPTQGDPPAPPRASRWAPVVAAAALVAFVAVGAPLLRRVGPEPRPLASVELAAPSEVPRAVTSPAPEPAAGPGTAPGPVTAPEAAPEPTPAPSVAPPSTPPPPPAPPAPVVEPPVVDPAAAPLVDGAVATDVAAAHTSTVTFVLEPGLVVETPGGVVRAPRQALLLASDQAHQLTVREGATTWPCTIVVGAGPSTVQVRTRAHGGCRQ